MQHPVTWQPSADQRRLIGHMILHKTDGLYGDLGFKVCSSFLFFGIFLPFLEELRILVWRWYQPAMIVLGCWWETIRYGASGSVHYSRQAGFCCWRCRTLKSWFVVAVVVFKSINSNLFSLKNKENKNRGKIFQSLSGVPLFIFLDFFYAIIFFGLLLLFKIFQRKPVVFYGNIKLTVFCFGKNLQFWNRIHNTSILSKKNH